MRTENRKRVIQMVLLKLSTDEMTRPLQVCLQMRVPAKEARWVPTCSLRGWTSTDKLPSSSSTVVMPTTASAALRDWSFLKRRPSKEERRQGASATSSTLSHFSYRRVLLNKLWFALGRRLLRYDNRCRHLREQQVQEKLAQGSPHVIRFRLETGVEPFQDIVFGWTHHEVAQVVSSVTFIILPSLTRFTECHFPSAVQWWAQMTNNTNPTM